MSLEEYSRRIIEVLKQNDIPFTIHWGKNSDWAYPNLVTHMYGEKKVNDWKQARSTILSDDMAELFANKFIKTVGLYQKKPHTNEANDLLV